MLRMQAELCGPDVDLPDIGDRSDDPIFPLDSTGGEAAGAFREIYRALFAPDMLPVDQGHPCVERAFWLLGGRLATSEQPGQELRFTDYPDSGIVMPGHLLASSFHGPAWLTGGTVGPEGSAFDFVVFAILFVVFDRVYRMKKADPSLRSG